MKRALQYVTLLTTIALAYGLNVQSGQAAVISVTGPIEKSTFWTSNNVYVLEGIIFVRSNATLTVQAGTVIRGRPDADTPGANNPGTLIVTRGSKIRLLGTEQAPIIFTDMNDDNYPGGAKSAPGYQTYNRRSAQWGGLAVCGRAYVARGTAGGPAPTNIQLEGLIDLGDDGKYGGIDDDDDSGTIRYVSIRYGGYGLAANNELNGLGLAGVGRGTAISHVEIVNNLDDGLEIWGGTVNVKYVVIWNAGDDSIDIDEGYRGKLQFLFAVQGQGATVDTVGGGVSDRGMELDGGNAPDASQPFCLWKMYNVTVVGKGLTGGQNQNYEHRDANVAIYMRDNAGGQIRNGVFVDFGGWMAHVENEGGTGAANAQTRFLTPWNGTGYLGLPYHRAQTDGNQAEISGCVFYQFGKGDAATAVSDLAANAASDASSINQSVPSTNVFLLASNVHNVLEPANPPIVAWTREDPSSLSNGVVRNVTSIDPRPANAALTSPLTAPIDGFFTPVNYRGAFSPNHVWVKNWTLIDALGLISSPPNPNAPTISIEFNAAKRPVIRVPTVNGVLYALESTTDQKHWSPITVFTGDGSIYEFEDTSPLSERASYRVVLP